MTFLCSNSLALPLWQGNCMCVYIHPHVHFPLMIHKEDKVLDSVSNTFIAALLTEQWFAKT